VLSGAVVLLQFSLFLLLGVGLACFYAAFPPAASFATNDHVFATFIVQQLPAGIGLIGVVLASVFAAAMSTLSSSLNSSSASAVNDLYAPLLGENANPSHLLRVSRLFTILFGVLQIGVGIAARQLTQSVVNDALAIAGFSAGLLLGIFALGVFVPRASQWSVLWGLLFGLATLLTVKFGLPQINPDWVVAWTWLPVVGSVSTFTMGWLLSTLRPSATPR
jgi:Na+/proline symporter